MVALTSEERGGGGKGGALVLRPPVDPGDKGALAWLGRVPNKKENKILFSPSLSPLLSSRLLILPFVCFLSFLFSVSEFLRTGNF